jgi:hypothetical protein
MRSTAKFTRAFFLFGIVAAAALRALPLLFSSLQTSNIFWLLNLILFPPSLFFSFTEKSPSTLANAVMTLSLLMLNGVVCGLVGVVLDWVVPMFLAVNRRQLQAPRLSDLPAWRKALIYAAFGCFVFMAARAVDTDLTTYAKAPDHPVPATGQVLLVTVEHGAIRYLTASEKASFDVWYGLAPTWGGAAFLCAVFLYVTSAKKADQQDS